MRDHGGPGADYRSRHKQTKDLISKKPGFEDTHCLMPGFIHDLPSMVMIYSRFYYGVVPIVMTGSSTCTSAQRAMALGKERFHQAVGVQDLNHLLQPVVLLLGADQHQHIVFIDPGVGMGLKVERTVRFSDRKYGNPRAAADIRFFDGFIHE
jgi:hypothetical protein